jgi:MscS family membrane protein
MPSRVRSAFVAFFVLFAALAASLPPSLALAQPQPTAPAPITAEAGAPDSPRASVSRFQDLCRAGEYAEAAAYLDTPDAQKPRAAELARRLHAVLDREMRLRIERLSPDSLGKQDDKLPPSVDEVGVIAGRSGPEPVRVVRRLGPDGARWIFSRNTVEHVDAWFDRLEGRWLEDTLPAPLLRTGPEELLVWQWIALPILFIAAWIVGRLLAFASGRVLVRLAARADRDWETHLRGRLGAPLSFGWALAAVYFTVPYLGLSSGALAFLTRLLTAGALIAFFWLVVRFVDVAGARLLAQATTQKNPSARSLVPLGTKTLKIIIFAIAVTAALSELGFSVTSLVAGLGIGGVALALAAQKTVENLFGSLSISLDRPFRVGDVITVDTVTGTVEAIGLRSTRLRTEGRTRVTIPNGKLADMRIENVTDRDRIKFGCTLAVDQGAKPAELTAIIDGVLAALRAEPKTYKPSVSVVLARVSPSSLDIDVLAWFSTTDYDEFIALRQKMLLRFLEIIAGAGAKLARTPLFPG